MSEPGTAFIDIAVEALATALAHLPRAYRVTGSTDCPFVDTVRLTLESDEIAGHDCQVTCEVTDVGSTRTVLVRQVRG